MTTQVLPTKRVGLAAMTGFTAANCIANATWWMQPLLIGQWVSSGQLSESAAGFVVSAEMTTMALTGIAATHWLRVGSMRRWAVLGLLIALIASWWSLGAGSFALLAATRGVVGVGAGLVMTVYFMAVSRAAAPDKIFANVNLLNLLFGMLLVGSLPTISALLGTVTPLQLLIAVMVMLLLPLSWLPAELRFAATGPDTSLARAEDPPVLGSRYVWLLAIIAVLIGICSGVTFSASALIGAQTGLPQEAIDHALALGVVTAIPVTLLAGLIANRYGRVIPMAVALLGLASNLILIGSDPDAMQYRIAVAINVSGLYFALPFLFGAGAALDPQGRGGTYVGSAFTFAGAISPFIGGLVVQHLGMHAIVPAACAVLLISFLGFAFVNSKLPRHRPPTVLLAEPRRV